MERPKAPERKKTFGKVVRSIAGAASLLLALGGGPQETEAQTTQRKRSRIETVHERPQPVIEIRPVRNAVEKFKSENLPTLKEYFLSEDVKEQFKLLKTIQFENDVVRTEFINMIKEEVHPYLQYILTDAYNSEQLMKLKHTSEHTIKLDQNFLDAVKVVHHELNSFHFDTQREKLTFAVSIAKNIINKGLGLNSRNISNEYKSLVLLLHQYGNYYVFMGKHLIGIESPDINRNIGTPLFGNRRMIDRVQNANSLVQNRNEPKILNFRPRPNIASIWQSVWNFTEKIAITRGPSIILMSGHGQAPDANGYTTFRMYDTPNGADRIDARTIVESLNSKYLTNEDVRSAQNAPDIIIANFCFAEKYVKLLADEYEKQNEARKRFGLLPLPPIIVVASSDENQAQLIGPNGESEFINNIVLPSSSIKDLVRNIRNNTAHGNAAIFLIGHPRSKMIQLGENDIHQSTQLPG